MTLVLLVWGLLGCQRSSAKSETRNQVSAQGQVAVKSQASGASAGSAGTKRPRSSTAIRPAGTASRSTDGVCPSRKRSPLHPVRATGTPAARAISAFVRMCSGSPCTGTAMRFLMRFRVSCRRQSWAAAVLKPEWRARGGTARQARDNSAPRGFGRFRTSRNSVPSPAS